MLQSSNRAELLLPSPLVLLPGHWLVVLCRIATEGVLSVAREVHQQVTVRTVVFGDLETSRLGGIRCLS
jgi:hypothetical protein